MANSTDSPVVATRQKLCTLAALPGYLNEFELGPLTATKAMKISNLTHEGAAPTVRLVEDLRSARVPFAPSCFGGADGDRKGCLISIPQETADALVLLEEWALDRLSAQVPNIREIWVSCVRPSEKWPPCLRCKINTGGPRQVKYYNEHNEKCDAPSDWKQLSVNACLTIRGIYVQKSGAGMLIDITHLQYEDEGEEEAPF